MTEKEINLINRNRGNLKGQLTKLSASWKAEIGNAGEGIIQARLVSCSRIRIGLDELKVKYYQVVSDEQFPEIEGVLSVIEDELDSIELKIKSRLHKIKLPVLSLFKNVDNLHAHNVSLKLPDIPLPKFSGNYDEWHLFKSQFKNLIHSNRQ